MAKKCKQPNCVNNSYGEYCWMHKPRKPIKKLKRPKQKGKEYERWRKFREEVATPYLDKTYGHRCVDCGVGGKLDIDHLITRGSRPDLKYDLQNLMYRCRMCHIVKTNKGGI